MRPSASGHTAITTLCVMAPPRRGDGRTPTRSCTAYTVVRLGTRLGRSEPDDRFGVSEFGRYPPQIRHALWNRLVRASSLWSGCFGGGVSRRAPPSVGRLIWQTLGGLPFIIVTDDE
jgi:hypothetical protein